MLAIERIGDHAAADAAAGVEAVEHVSGLGVEREEVVVEIAGEQDAAGGRGDAGDERRRRGILPALLAGRGVERGQPAFRLFARVLGDGAAVIVHALHDRRILGRLAEDAAPIDGGHEQRVAAGIVGRTVPLHAAEQARAAMHAFDRRQRIDVLARGDRHLVELLVAVAVEQAQQPVLAADADDVALLAVDGRRRTAG